MVLVLCLFLSSFLCVFDKRKNTITHGFRHSLQFLIDIVISTGAAAALSKRAQMRSNYR